LVNYSQSIHVLDATAFIGLDFPILLAFEVERYLTAHSVIDELKDFRSKMNLEVMRQSKKFEISSPDPQKLAVLKQNIYNLDPNTRLSNTDIHVLTLAEQVKGVLVTNDLAMQNIAKLLNIKVRVIGGKKIKEIRRSHLRCLSCKRTFQASERYCPECGGELKQYFHKRKLKENQGK